MLIQTFFSIRALLFCRSLSFAQIVMPILFRPFLSLSGFALVAAAALCMSSVATAGNFSVSPVRIFMRPSERATAITIVNQGDTDLVLETELTIWKQNPDGSFNQQLTDDVIAAPPQMRLPPKGRQIVRVARVIPATPGVQMTYRLLVREVPEAGPAKPGYNVNVALAFSLPIFITPAGFKHDVSCKLAAASVMAAAAAPAPADGKPAEPSPAFIARCDNAGSAHALITSVKFFDVSGEVASSKQPGYTLVNSGRPFPIFKTNEALALPQGSLRMVISHDDNTQQTVNVTLPQ